MSNMPLENATPTPGPWVADRVHPDWPGCLVRYVEAPGLHDEICTLYGGESNDANRLLIEANARLLAAAPDLLAALVLLHDNLAEYQRINNLGGYENHDMKMARAAIAKARGTP